MEIQFRTETNKLRNTSNEMKDKECTDKERNTHRINSIQQQHGSSQRRGDTAKRDPKKGTLRSTSGTHH